MSNVFLVADTHFGHLGVCKFLTKEGEKLRPWTTPEEMDEDMIEKWNKVVGPKDKVYHFGDVVINRKALKTLHRLNGDKVLIKGNHDIFNLKDYVEHFRDIRAYHVMNKYILSHIPVHTESKGRFVGNIHGHLHSNRVMIDDKIDPYYHCVSVEQIDFAPISFEDVMKRIREENS